VTYSGPSKGLQAYATKVYAQAGMGQPPVANAPEVREGGNVGRIYVTFLYFSREIANYSFFFLLSRSLSSCLFLPFSLIFP
jgi:hypothetical protein